MTTTTPARTAVVTVRTRCTCVAATWYRCTCSNEVAVYDCLPFDGMEKVPHPMQVALVEARHPGCDLIYPSIGSSYEGHLNSCRRELVAKAKAA